MSVTYSGGKTSKESRETFDKLLNEWDKISCSEIFFANSGISGNVEGKVIKGTWSAGTVATSGTLEMLNFVFGKDTSIDWRFEYCKQQKTLSLLTEHDTVSAKISVSFEEKDSSLLRTVAKCEASCTVGLANAENDWRLLFFAALNRTDVLEHLTAFCNRLATQIK